MARRDGVVLTMLATRVPKDLHRRLRLHCVNAEIVRDGFEIHPTRSQAAGKESRCARLVGNGGDGGCADAVAYRFGPETSNRSLRNSRAMVKSRLGLDRRASRAG